MVKMINDYTTKEEGDVDFGSTPESGHVGVYITQEAYDEIMYYVHKCPMEIGGLGKIVRIAEGLLVNKVYLPKQEVSSGDVEMSPGELSDCLLENIHDPGEMCFWWHSHVNMAVYWSTTDLSTIRQLGNNGVLVASVFNKRNESRTAVYLGSPQDSIRPDVFLDELTLNIHKEVGAVRDDLDAIYDANVTTATYIIPNYNKSYNQGWDADGDYGEQSPVNSTMLTKESIRRERMLALSLIHI